MNLSIYEKCREVPENAKKPISAGRLKGKTDINPMWRIKKLTELFGPCGIGWYYTVETRWTEEAGGEIAAFVDINLYVKSGEEWSKPIHGTGGSMLAANEKSGLHLSDECYKMATTDAISVACKQLGIGADVYWAADNTKYMLAANEKSGLHLSDECYKMATTDAISVACKQLGIGADVYWAADNTKYTRGERTPDYNGSAAASAPMLKQIESICKKHGTTPEQVCKANSVMWEGISAEMAAQMLVFLKKQYGDE